MAQHREENRETVGVARSVHVIGDEPGGGAHTQEQEGSDHESGAHRSTMLSQVLHLHHNAAQLLQIGLCCL